jgi:hypothetical protein
VRKGLRVAPDLTLPPAAYEEQDGKKVVTTLKVFPSSRGR